MRGRKNVSAQAEGANKCGASCLQTFLFLGRPFGIRPSNVESGSGSEIGVINNGSPVEASRHGE